MLVLAPGVRTSIKVPVAGADIIIVWVRWQVEQLTHRGFCARRKGGMAVETPEIEFLQYLLTRYIKNYELDPAKMSVDDLLGNINMNLMPVGGG